MMWLLSEEEIEEVVKEWADRDCVNYIRLIRGHYEEVALIIAQAQAKKLVEWIEEQAKYNTSTLTQLDFFQSPFWRALKKEVGIKDE